MSLIEQLAVESLESTMLEDHYPDFLKSEPEERMRINRHIPLRNGIELSVQASASHSCAPRKTVAMSEYSHVEVAVIKDGDFSTFEEAFPGIVVPSSVLDNHDVVYSMVPVSFVEHILSIYY